MRTFFKKSLIYTLVFGMLAPTWLVGTLLSAQKAEAAWTQSPSASQPRDLAFWNFSDATNNLNGAGTAYLVDSSTTENSTSNITTTSDSSAITISSGTNPSAYSKGWTFDSNVAKYWSTTLSTKGYESILVNSDQTSSGTGPKDFQLQYQIGNGIWQNVSDGAVSMLGTGFSGSLSDVQLPTSTENQASISLRWLLADGSRADGSDSTISGTGTNHIDNIVITGQAIQPEFTKMGLTLDGQAVAQDVSHGFILGTQVAGPDMHHLDISSESALNVALTDGYYGFKLSNSSSVLSKLQSYFSAKPWPTSYKTGIYQIISGNQPTFYLKATTVNGVQNYSLIDGFTRDVLHQADGPVQIDADYPEGTYSYAGTLTGISGADNDMTVKMTVDNTAPTLTLNPDIVNTNETYDGINVAVFPYGNTYTDPGFVANDNIDGNINSKVEIGYLKMSSDLSTATEIQKLDTKVPGIYAIVYGVADQAGNSVGFDPKSLIMRVVIVEMPQEITLASGDNPTLDLSAIVIGNAATLVNGLKVTAVVTNVSTTVEFAAGTNISAASWDGTLNLPQLAAVDTSKVKVDSGYLSSDLWAVEIGNGDNPLTLDKPAKLTFAGQASKTNIGFIKSGVYTPISLTCALDASGNPTNLTGTNYECKTVSPDGKDLIIWTLHYTVYVTYNQTKVVAPAFIDTNFTVTKVNKDSGKFIDVVWDKIAGADGYDTFINNVLSTATTTLSDHSAEYKVDYGTFNIVVKAYKKDALGNKIYSTNTATKAAEFDKPVATVVTTTPIVTVAPQKAEAAATTPATTPATTGTTDQNGVIKGAETQDNSSSSSVNWTPWIILFVLIILAGAATGGYFYWFAGKEEIEEISKPVKKTVSAKIVKSAVRAPKKNNKKARRW